MDNEDTYSECGSETTCVDDEVGFPPNIMMGIIRQQQRRNTPRQVFICDDMIGRMLTIPNVWGDLFPNRRASRIKINLSLNSFRSIGPTPISEIQTPLYKQIEWRKQE